MNIEYSWVAMQTAGDLTAMLVHRMPRSQRLEPTDANAHVHGPRYPKINAANQSFDLPFTSSTSHTQILPDISVTSIIYTNDYFTRGLTPAQPNRKSR